MEWLIGLAGLLFLLLILYDVRSLSHNWDWFSDKDDEEDSD